LKLLEITVLRKLGTRDKENAFVFRTFLKIFRANLFCNCSETVSSEKLKDFLSILICVCF